MDTFAAELNAFVEHLKEMFRKNYEKPDQLTLEPGISWCRIVRIREGNAGKSVYAFVAMKDSSNRNLGMVKAGDIHMPASWAAPAKHARGSIFNKESWVCAGPHGIAYLK